MPVWEEGVIEQKKPSEFEMLTTNSNSDSTFAVIPIVPVGTKEVNALFACKIVGDSVTVKLLKEKDYSKYGFNSNNQYSGNTLVAIMMYLQHKVFNTKYFVVNDGRLFSSPGADSSNKRLIKIKESSNDGLSSLVNFTHCVEFSNVGCGSSFYSGTCSLIFCYHFITGSVISLSYYMGNQYIVGGTGSGYNGGTGSGGDNGGGGSGNDPSGSVQSLLQGTLALTPPQVDFLWQNQNMVLEAWTYIHNSDGSFTSLERKQMAIQQVQFLMSNNAYLNYCLEQYMLHYNQTSGLGVEGWSSFWFNQLYLEYTNPELYSNIQNLKLNPQQAYYLLNNPAISLQLSQFLEINNLNPLALRIADNAILENMLGRTFPLIMSPSVQSQTMLFDNQIDDQLTNDCLKAVLNKIKSLKNGKVGEIIVKFSGDFPNWKWELKEGTLPPNYNGTTTLMTGGASTTLDYNKLKNGTNLSIARTMIHESIHAYLTVYFRYDPINAGKDYPGMLKAWYKKKHPDYNSIQHDQMEKTFVAEIASALKEYGLSIGLNLDDQVYTDLAWGGLDFNSNTQLNDDDRVRIQNRISAEQNNSTFDGISPAGQKICN